jgi:hypothetical protein
LILLFVFPFPEDFDQLPFLVTQFERFYLGCPFFRAWPLLNVADLGTNAPRTALHWDRVAPSERYRRSFPPCEQRDALIQTAQVWQRLAGQYDDGTPPFSLSAAATKQPVVQQQQQSSRRLIHRRVAVGERAVSVGGMPSGPALSS